MERSSGSDDRQARIADVLEGESPRLAGMYRSALNLLYNDPEPGCEIARVSMICHCMRELMTNLLANVDGFIKRIEPSSSSLVSKLPNLLAKHPALDLELEQDLIPVPKEVAQHFAMLNKARVQEDGRNQKNAAAFITGGSSLSHPATKQWKNTNNFFVGWAHLDQNHERRGSLPSDEELLDSMCVVEDIIEVHAAVFFDNVHAVDDLLARANASSEEDM
jgi:hypothetical protein